MTRSDLLARLERLENEARLSAEYGGQLGWKYANDHSLAVTAGSEVAENAARDALDALALSEARAALQEQVDLLWQAFQAGFDWHSNGMGRYDAYCGAPAATGFAQFLRSLPTPPTEARAALSAQGWQPIASAPKDGTELLLAEYRNGQYGTIEHGAWEFLERSEWDGVKVYGWSTDSGRIDEPTHWMRPLPVPPPPTEEL